MTFKLYNYVLSGNCYKVRLMAALLGVSEGGALNIAGWDLMG